MIWILEWEPESLSTLNSWAISLASKSKNVLQTSLQFTTELFYISQHREQTLEILWLQVLILKLCTCTQCGGSKDREIEEGREGGREWCRQRWKEGEGEKLRERLILGGKGGGGKREWRRRGWDKTIQMYYMKNVLP